MNSYLARFFIRKIWAWRVDSFKKHVDTSDVEET